MCNVCVYAGADTTRSEIENKEAYWAATLASGDIAALSAMYEDHAWLIVPGGEPFKGREAIRAALSGLKSNTSWMNLKTVTVEKIANDFAIENGVAEMLPLGGGARIQRSNYQVLWHKAPKGDWKIVRDMVSPSSMDKASTQDSAPAPAVAKYSIPAVEGMCEMRNW
jgi:uncharacterized protein (TIGR02246 family)